MWKFTKSQIAEFIQYRQQQLPDGYFQHDEMLIINNYCCTFLPTLFKSEKNLNLTLISYAAILFKRYYMIKTIFESTGMHQILICCSYLGMKLNGLSQQSIGFQAQKLKKMPKHERFQHFGDEFYAKNEMFIVQALGYDIDIKPIYPIIQSVIFIFRIKDLLEQSLLIRFDKKIEEYFLKSLQGFTIFTYKESEISLAIVECSLQSIFIEILQPSKSLEGIPLKPNSLDKMKKYLQEKKQNGTLIIKQIDQRDINIENNCQQIQELVHFLQNIKDISGEFEKHYELYKQIKQKIFSLQMNVEFMEVKKQVTFN